MDVPIRLPPGGNGFTSGLYSSSSFDNGANKFLHATFPSEVDTLAYVDALKNSNFSQWRSLEEVAKHAGGGSCLGVVNTSVLTALYLLGLFNLCAASPASCCVPPSPDRRKRRSSDFPAIDDNVPPLFNTLNRNLSSLSLEQFKNLPHVTTPDGGRIPIHISVVDQVRKLWDSNPRLLSNIPCNSATASVRSSFISLSGVASGIILAYSIAQLSECYPDHRPQGNQNHRIWFYPVPLTPEEPEKLVRSLPTEIPVLGEDDPEDGCDRHSVRMEDGRCARLLSPDRCPFMHWVLINRETGMGECIPRLCSDGKVFVEKDQMCHPVDEGGFCPTGQRLYLTAWGEAVCDCLDGTFPGADGKCHRLYEPAYCNDGNVLDFHQLTKALTCKVDPCVEINSRRSATDLPYAIAPRNGVCYKMGSVGPCGEFRKFGYDIEELSPSCVSLGEAGLVKPHRSFQYSHMSFPSAQDNGVPHYEVSYVILNGSTWELMMNTVGRRRGKRSTQEENDNEVVIKFLDTRDFPQDIDEVLPALQELNLLEEDDSLNEEEDISNWKIKTLPQKENIINDNIKKMKIETADSKKVEFKKKTLIENAESGPERNKYVRNKKAGTDKLGKLGIIHIATVKGLQNMNNETFAPAEQAVKILKDEQKKLKADRYKHSKIRKRKNKIKKKNKRKRNKHTRKKKQKQRKIKRLQTTQRIDQNNFIKDKTLPKMAINEKHNKMKINIKDKAENSIIEEKDKTANKTFDNCLTTPTVFVVSEMEISKSNRVNKPSEDRINLTPSLSAGKNNITNPLRKRENKRMKSSTQPPHPGRNLRAMKINLKSQHIKSKLHRKNLSSKPKENKTRKMKWLKNKRRGKKRQKTISNKNKKLKKKKMSAKEEIKIITNKEQRKILADVKEPGIIHLMEDKSLPYYLRNRGRRQAGGKRGRAIPGIINAPLLNQCRPGAKRDYNGHCRPKIIPQIAKYLRFKKRDNRKSALSYPRIKCIKGTRLDSRGVCRKTFRGLG